VACQTQHDNLTGLCLHRRNAPADVWSETTACFNTRA